jgi:hypothetical protein
MSFLVGVVVGVVTASLVDPLHQLYGFMSASNFSNNALFDSVRIMLQIGYLRLTQVLNQSCIQIRPGLYELRYTVKGRLYSSIVEIPRGPIKD